MDKSELCLVPFTWHTSAVSLLTGIKIELDQTLKTLLVQRHLVLFGQNFCYIREEDYLFYQKSAGSHFMLFWSTHNYDYNVCISKKCTHAVLYIVIFYKNINETRISSQHFFKSAEYKLSISIILAWTVECMPLHFLVLCRICSLYGRFSWHFKSLQGLVGS